MTGGESRAMVTTRHRPSLRFWSAKKAASTPLMGSVGRTVCLAGVLLASLAANVWAKESGPVAFAVGATFSASDTLSCGEDPDKDTQECLDQLAWKRSEFAVELQRAEPGFGEFLVRFPSSHPIGNATNDRVAMEWFPAHDENEHICTSRAVVVVHESGSRMLIGRLIARGFSAKGFHAFLVHLPGYGVRRDTGLTREARELQTMKQAIADVRRARDAVAAIPVVDASCMGIQGTSLGGFVTATVAGLDRGFDRVFILLAGGNLEDVVLHGAKDAARVRQRLQAAGINEAGIKKLAREVEPLRVAHRLRSEYTWLFTGKYDDVVPPRCSLALAKAAKLPTEHHVILPADHYSGAIYLPQVMQTMCDEMSNHNGERGRAE